MGRIEPGDQLGQRRLAGPGRPDQRQAHAGRDVQRHVLQHPRAAGVGERHGVDLDVPGRRQVDRPARSGTSTRSSSSSYSLWSPAPADWTMLNSWLSCCTGSNRLDSVRTKNATVPTVRRPSWTHQPPMPSARAVVPHPASSITGRYQAEIFTERMWLSYSSRLPASNRPTSTSSRANACTTRTPAMPSWRCDSVLPMRSRTRGRPVRVRWNLMLARITGGSARPHTSMSCHDTLVSTASEMTSRAFDTNIVRPICTSSDSESTSEVMRDTSTPALDRS